MMSSSGETTPEFVDSEDREDREEETASEEHSFENPNYRKLYAALSITSMMGHNNQSVADHAVDHHLNGSVGGADELPLGWERHEDEDGPYFWHIPSGHIQRQAPIGETPDVTRRDSLIYMNSFDDNMDPNKCHTNGDNKQTEDNVLTFVVNSLGWMDVEESQLTSATSSKLIQKCIIELSTRGDNNAVRCWGRQTQQLVLKIEGSCLKLYDMTGDTLLNSHPIRGLRVWGVNDNNDFAFVAKDSNESNCQTSGDSEADQKSPLLGPSGVVSNELKCHVFHCEDDSDSAQRIATYLRDEMIRLKSDMEGTRWGSPPQRPKNLFIYESGKSPASIATPTAIEFPTPIEEPRKAMAAKYLGKMKVTKPMGIDVLNKAIETILFNENNDSSVGVFNTDVLVHISPSTITVECKETAQCLAECRVRYLSFLGIGSTNVKTCGFIMQIDDNQFEALCFECEPSSGAFCKTIEAACKLRYQKCLDAHRQRLAPNNAIPSQNSSRIKSTIFNVFSKISNNIKKN
ncbi:unnamed protein product [Medioppia subpectinata]|uniref:PID domain-containing protein n=1 Tax=Medioppia subpectinata TaxID=1979941 RepID=A0A7R9KZ72_9ACAR|nr:unnamed protein product [Medioppia subpectinata]CAG2112353.1 unnamed protein product [Medioppia subpectinata]